MKLVFFFRIRLSHFWISNLLQPSSALVCDCLATLASSLSRRIGGEDSNEDFYLTLTDYSSFLFQTAQFYVNNFEEISRSSAVENAIVICTPEIKFHFFNFFYTRTRVEMFLTELLRIAIIICPTVTSIATCSCCYPLTTDSLSNRLQALNLPSYVYNCRREDETSHSHIERDMIQGIVACRLITNVLTVSRERKDFGFLYLRRRALQCA